MTASISAPEAEGRAERTRSAAWLLPVIGVLTVAAVLVCAALAYRANAASQLESARSEGLDSARSAAKVFMAYDYRRLDRDFERARSLLTGDFRKEYSSTTTNIVTPTATKTHAVVRADVQAASVVSATPERVVTLLFVNQTTTSNRASEPRTDLTRVRMTLQRVRDRWLVSKVDAL